MKNFRILLFASVVAAILAGCDQNRPAQQADCPADAVEIIMQRKSVRVFTDQAVEDEKVEVLLRAAMAAPSGMDRRPWHFVVVDDADVRQRLSEVSPNWKMAAAAPLAVVVCGDTEVSAYWYLDCSAAVQNLLLAAEAQGLGAVWTAAYPYDDRMDPVIEILGLPENIKPLAVIPVGYPAGKEEPKDKYDPSRIHRGRW